MGSDPGGIKVCYDALNPFSYLRRSQLEQRITYRWQWVGCAYPIAIFGYLLLAWYTCYKVDFLQQPSALFPWLESLIDGSTAPLLWLILFGEASITENLQWFSLLLAAFFAGLVAVQSKQARLAAAIFCFGLLWMYAEDCYNVRHLVTAWAGESIFGYEPTDLVWIQSRTRTLIELSIYIVMASVMVWGYIAIWQKKYLSQSGFAVLTAGYLLYGVAAFSSATRHAFNWYERVGAIFFDFIADKTPVALQGSDVIFHRAPLGYWWMDYVVEESLELLAASLLMAAAFLLLLKTSEDLAKE